MQLLRSIPALHGLLIMDAAVFTGWALWLTIVPLHAVSVWGATPGTLGLMYTVMVRRGVSVRVRALACVFVCEWCACVRVCV